MKTLFTLLLFFLFSFSLFAKIEEKKVHLATLDWKPYVGQSLYNNGLIYEIVKTAFERVGYKVKISFFPFARALEEAKEGRVDGYFPEYFNKKLEKDFFFSLPYFDGPVGFVRKKGHLPELKTRKNMTDFSSLKGKSIGVVRDYTNTTAFDNNNEINKIIAGNDTENLKKLFFGRIDAAFIDLNVADYLLNKELNKNYKNINSLIEFVQPALEVKQFYTCFSKKSPNAKTLVKDFNLGFSLMFKDGKIKEIMERYQLLYLFKAFASENSFVSNAGPFPWKMY